MAHLLGVWRGGFQTQPSAVATYAFHGRHPAVDANCAKSHLVIERAAFHGSRAVFDVHALAADFGYAVSFSAPPIALVVVLAGLGLVHVFFLLLVVALQCFVVFLSFVALS